MKSEKNIDKKNNSFLIDNITQIDVESKKLRIIVANKCFFPKEIKGNPKTYNIKVNYKEKEYDATYTIGSKDCKSRSGIISLGAKLYQEIIKISPEMNLKVTILENGKYEIKKDKMMKGKRKFSEHEANQIRKLINQKVLASTNEQKGIRNVIREKYGFYFSDFSSKKGYKVENFEKLIKTKEIRITN